jgi:hypothetical protein
MKNLFFRIKEGFTTSVQLDESVEEMKTLDQHLKELPVWIIKKSIPVLKECLGTRVIFQIQEDSKNDPELWWADKHHGWGTAVRNHLRDNVCLDEELPSGNWDDYYIQLVELACEIRTIS